MAGGTGSLHLGCKPRIPERTRSTGFSSQLNVRIENLYFLADIRRESCSPKMIEGNRTIPSFQGDHLDMPAWIFGVQISTTKKCQEESSLHPLDTMSARSPSENDRAVTGIPGRVFAGEAWTMMTAT